MSRRLAIFVLSLLLAAGLGSSRADEGDASCLSQGEREALAARNKETLKALGWDELQERMAEYGAVMREALAARKEVEDCQQNGSGFLGIACREQIRNHNRLIERGNALANYIKTKTEMTRDMLRLNRSLFRTCG